MRVTVLSTFDIWPARDGGQFRYAEIWSKFSPEHEVTIIAYDFKNVEVERRYQLAANVRVIVPKAANGDARHFFHMMEKWNLWLHDILCFEDYSFSDEFLNLLSDEISTSDVVVSSHPYLARVAFPYAPRRTLKVYESYNVERDIKARYLETMTSRDLRDQLIATVERGERYAAREAHHVTAVSAADRERLIELYNLPESKVSVVPNGVNVSGPILNADDRADARARLKVSDDLVGVFIGSNYGANVKSYAEARLLLDRAGFKGSVLLIGSINKVPLTEWPPVGFSERWFGFVDDAVKKLLLESSDFAIQLIFDGAGTNLKLFDYMAAGLPIFANAFGARGVAGDDWFVPMETAAEASDALARLGAGSGEMRQRGDRARAIALERYDWRAIASDFETRMRDGFPIPSAQPQPA